MTTVIVKETGIQVVTVGTQGPSGTGGGGGGGNGDMAVATYDPASKAEQVLTISDMLDEDDFSSNSETKAPTQQSVKVYVDNGLAEKASASHTHTLSDLTDAGSMAAESADDYYTSAEVDTVLDAKASASHTHTLSDVTDAGSMAAESADDYYTSAEVDTALGSKADSSHTHVISEVTGLQTALDAKASASHTHTLSDVTDAGSMAAESADDYYTSAEVDSALGSKADSSHTHAINEVTGLQSALDAKASAAHTHTLSDVTDAGSMAAESADDYYTSAEVDSALDSYVASDNTGVTGADKVGNIMTLTQSEYNAITPISDTLYFVTV